MSAIASKITSLTIVYSAVYSGADQIKHQRSASLAFVRGIHRWPVNSPHKWPVSRKMFPFDDVNRCCGSVTTMLCTASWSIVFSAICLFHIQLVLLPSWNRRLGQMKTAPNYECINGTVILLSGVWTSFFNTRLAVSGFTRCYVFARWHHGPLARYVKLWFAHASGMPGTFSPPPT